MNDAPCPRCGGTNPPNSPFCSTCGTPLASQGPVSVPPPQPPADYPPQPSPGYYPPPGAAKILGDKTKWALGLGIASFFCCGPITGVIGIFLAKQDMDEIAAGRAPQLDAGWAKAAFYINLAATVLSILGICLFWGTAGMRRLL